MYSIRISVSALTLGRGQHLVLFVSLAMLINPTSATPVNGQHGEEILPCGCAEFETLGEAGILASKTLFKVTVYEDEIPPYSQMKSQCRNYCKSNYETNFMFAVESEAAGSEYRCDCYPSDSVKAFDCGEEVGVALARLYCEDKPEETSTSAGGGVSVFTNNLVNIRRGLRTGFGSNQPAGEEIKEDQAEREAHSLSFFGEAEERPKRLERNILNEEGRNSASLNEDETMVEKIFDAGGAMVAAVLGAVCVVALVAMGLKGKFDRDQRLKAERKEETEEKKGNWELKHSATVSTMVSSGSRPSVGKAADSAVVAKSKSEPDFPRLVGPPIVFEKF